MMERTITLGNQLARWNGSGVDVARDVPPVHLSRGARKALAQTALQMHYQTLIATFVGEEISRLSAHIFRLTIDTLWQMSLEMERATFLDNDQRAQLIASQTQYMTMMTGISNYAAMQLFRMLEQVPDLAARRGLLDELRNWFVAN